MNFKTEDMQGVNPEIERNMKLAAQSLSRAYINLKEGLLRKFLAAEDFRYIEAHRKGKWVFYPDKTESFFWEDRRIFSISGELGAWEVKWHEDVA